MRPLEDLPEDSPDDLIHHDLKTWRRRQDLGGLRLKQIDGIWQDVQRRLRSPCCNRLGVWEPTSSAGQYKADETIPCVPPTNLAILSNTNRKTGRRVLLSGGPNQYKFAVFSVFRVLVCDLRVLSLRHHPAKQLNHRD
jgi:hypothetical protein